MTVRISTSGWVHPHRRVNFDRFAQFLGVLPCDYQHVVEFRDASWLNKEVWRDDNLSRGANAA